MANKIIDKNGKLFGKISIIDVLAILLIIAAIVVISIKISSKNEKISTDKVTVEYTMRVSAVRNYSKEALEKSKIVYSSPNDDEKVNVGEIINTIIINDPAKELKQTSNGEYVYVDVPNKYDIEITIKADVDKNYYGYFFSDKLQLLSNSEFSIYNDYVKLTGTIIDFKEK